MNTSLPNPKARVLQLKMQVFLTLKANITNIDVTVTGHENNLFEFLILFLLLFFNVACVMVKGILLLKLMENCWCSLTI